MAKTLVLALAVSMLACAAAAPAAAGSSGYKLRMQRQAESLKAPGSVAMHMDWLAATGNSSIVSVAAFGAVPDGKTDNTAAFQAALNSLPDGGVVWVPAGQYSFDGCITVPTAVTLEGTYRAVPSHNVGQGGLAPTDGTVLMPRGGRNNASACPFISLFTDSTLRGVVVYYPEQDGNSVPVPYPYAVSMTGNNPAIVDVELLNPFNGIYAVGAARHYIARVQGQPANVGVYVDKTYDIGRIDNVHFNPWFSGSKTYMSWQLLHGRAFVFARTDWEYVFNCFAFGYAIGYHFIKSPEGSCNGNFLGIGADMAANASVMVEAADPWGIMITNGEFTSFVSSNFGTEYAQSTQVVVQSTDVGGAVRFVNSAFWGPSSQIANIAAPATVGFSSCTFSQWDAHNKGLPAISATAGQLIVQGCEFQMAGTQLLLESGVKKAIFLGNVIEGAENVVTNGVKIQSGFNAAG